MAILAMVGQVSFGGWGFVTDIFIISSLEATFLMDILGDLPIGISRATCL